MGPDPSSTTTRPPRRLRVSDVTVVDKSMMRRAVSGMVVGNTMEWYDVGVYGYLAVTMGKVFLPTAEPSVQILFSLGVFAATYVARPLGGIVFGRLGDRLGRQKVLATTLVLMASSTFLIGVLPAWSTIGAVAPVVLVVLKLAQGFSTGGEYAGATTFVTEYAPDRRRGFFASILDFGSYMGFALGATVVTVLQVTLGDETMTAWGWRLPFLLAGVIGVVAIWFRLRIEESPVFQATQAAQEAAASDREAAEGGRPANVLVMVRDHWRPIVIAIMLVGASNTVGYALTSYMPTYLTDSLGYSAIDGTLLTIPVLVLLAVMLPVAGSAVGPHRASHRDVDRRRHHGRARRPRVPAHRSRCAVVDPRRSRAAGADDRAVGVEPGGVAARALPDRRPATAAWASRTTSPSRCSAGRHR